MKLSKLLSACLSLLVLAAMSTMVWSSHDGFEKTTSDEIVSSVERWSITYDLCFDFEKYHFNGIATGWYCSGFLKHFSFENNHLLNLAIKRGKLLSNSIKYRRIHSFWLGGYRLTS